MFYKGYLQAPIVNNLPRIKYFLLARLVFNNLRAFDVVPVVTESLVMNIAGQVLTFLGLIGVIVDPTTAGVGDSERALGYEEPWEDPEK